MGPVGPWEAELASRRLARAKSPSDETEIQDLIDRLRIRFAPYFLNDHPKRVAEIADQIAQVMGYSVRYRRMLAVLAILHDIGKVHPDCQHLYTSGNLKLPFSEKLRKFATSEHQRYGPDVLGAMNLREFERYRERIRPMCSHHHDDFVRVGDPPPPRLAKEICIVAIADAWDALISNVKGEENERGYRKARSKPAAAAVLYRDGLRGKFDLAICRHLVHDIHGLTGPEVTMGPKRASVNLLRPKR